MKKLLTACLALLMMVSLVGCGSKKVEMDLVSFSIGDSTYQAATVSILSGYATFDSDEFENGTIVVQVEDSKIEYQISDKTFYKTTDSGNQMYQYTFTEPEGGSGTGFGIIGTSGDKHTITLGVNAGNTSLMFYYKQK